MPNEVLISRIEKLLNGVVALGGQSEQTRIVTNMTVIDAAPAALTGYVIIQDNRDGDYIPAKKVPGVLYANGDLVNVLFIEGTEPVAFQQASESSGSPLAVSKLVSPDLSIDPVLAADNSGDVTLSTGGDLLIPDDIIHAGDTDTLISLEDDKIVIQAGGLEMLSVIEAATDEVVINDAQVDIDFRVEGDTVEYLLFSDAGNDRVLIGSATPPTATNSRLVVVHTHTDHTSGIFSTQMDADVVLASNATAQTYRAVNAQIDSSGAGGNTGDLTGLVFSARINSGGNWTTLQAVSCDARVLGAGNVTNGYGYRIIPVVATGGGNLTSWFAFEARAPSVSGGGAITTAHGIYIAAQKATGVTTGYGVRQVGAADLNEFLGGVTLGSPTGGNKGAGTMNVATDIYKNNSAYTNPDYALEHYFSGEIERYRDNPGAADYGGLLPLHKLRDYLADNLHLPGRSDEASGIFERADLAQQWLEELAVYITQLNDRLFLLEKHIYGNT
jgi:hypothetical protein